MIRRLLCLLFVLWAIPAAATTRYVAKTGNDSNPGTLVSPYLTIRKGIQQSTAADDQLLVRVGSYNECVNESDLSSGTSGHPIIIKNYNSEVVWLAPTCGDAIGIAAVKSYITFDGIGVDMAGVASEAGVYIGFGAHHITLQNLTVKNQHHASTGGAGINVACSNGDSHDVTLHNLDIIDNGSKTAGGAVNQQHGIYITDGCTNWIVEDSRVSLSGGCGIQIFGVSHGRNDGGIIRRNILHDNDQNPNWGCAGIQAGGGDNQKIYNNLVYQGTCLGTSCMGISVDYNSPNATLVANNTITGFTGATGSYFALYIAASATSTVAKNNLIYHGTPEYLNSGTSTTCTNNLFGGAAGTGCTSSVANATPAFTNAGTGDYTLLVTSVAINAGADLTTSGVTDDLTGVARPQGGTFDIGAYEFVVSGSSGHTAVGPLALISETHGGSSASATTVATSATAHTAGNTLICGITWATLSGVTFSSIANTAGDTWHLVPSEIVSGIGDTQRVMYAYDINGSASDVITVTFSGATIYRTLTCKEFHGIDYNAGDPRIDSAGAESSSGTLMSTRALSMGGNADALLFGYVEAAGADTTAGAIVGGAGLTTNNFAATGDPRLYFADVYGHVTSNTAASATAATTTYWVVTGATFKSFPPATTTTAIHSGDDLQAALDAATCGTTLVLDAGVTWTANHTLTKTCTADAPLTITSSGTLPASGVRVGCVTDLAQLGTIATSNTSSAMLVGFASDYIYFTGVRFYSSYADVTPGNSTFNIVAYGVDGSGNDATSLAQLPDHIVMDRVCVSGNDSGNSRRGILANTKSFTLKNSDVRKIHEVGNQSNAVAVYNGQGPFLIQNNRIEGASQNFLAGGNDSGIPGMIASDGVVTRNLFTKPLEWKYSCVLSSETGCNGHFYAGTRWGIANIFELKCAQRWDIYGNIFENSWPDVQAGTAIVFTPRNQSGGNPTCLVDDILFRSNLVRNAGQGWSVLGTDDTHTSGPARNIRIRNSLWEDIHVDSIPALGLESNGFFGAVTHGSTSLEVSHNTTPTHGRSWIFFGETPELSTGLILKDDISTHGYGVAGGVTAGTVTLDAFTSGGYTFSHELLAGMVEDGNNLGQYPATTLTSTYAALTAGWMDAAAHDYRLLATSAGYRAASDGHDVGYDPCDGVFPDPAGDGSTAQSCVGVSAPTGRPRVRMLSVALDPRDIGAATYRAFKGQLATGAN